MRKELAPEWALLGLLTQKPMHGYELYRYFTDPSTLGQVWYLGLSQMYKLLKELEGRGYLEATLEEQENYPDRKVYHITPAGRAAFLQWMEKPVKNTRLIRVEFLAKLFLAQLLGSEMIKRVIDTQLEACQAQLTHLLDAETWRGGGHGREWRPVLSRACPEASPEQVEGQSRRVEGMENGETRMASDESFEYLIFCFRRGQVEAIIDWLRTCRRVFLPDNPTAKVGN